MCPSTTGQGPRATFAAPMAGSMQTAASRSTPRPTTIRDHASSRAGRRRIVPRGKLAGDAVNRLKDAKCAPLSRPVLDRGRGGGRIMRTNNLVVLFVAIVMGGVAAFLARSWLESHAGASTVGTSVGTIVVAAQPLGFGVSLTSENITEIPWAAQELPEGAF